jgi:hypothetical protein
MEPRSALSAFDYEQPNIKSKPLLLRPPHIARKVAEKPLWCSMSKVRTADGPIDVYNDTILPIRVIL